MSERHDVLAQAIQRLEGLRLQHPMNGDGANYMLDKAIKRLASESSELQQVATDAATAHREQWEREYLDWTARYARSAPASRDAQ